VTKVSVVAKKKLCAGPKHFDQLKSESDPNRNSTHLQLCSAVTWWRWPVMRLWRLNTYGAIMATLLF